MTDITITTAIDNSETIQGVRAINKSLQELKTLQSQVGEGSAEFKKLGAAINAAEGRIGDINDRFKTFAGSGVERVNSSIGLLKESLFNLDPEKASIAFEGLGAAMKAIPIFLLIEGIKLIIDNFDKVKAVLDNIIPSWKAQKDAIKENLDYLTMLNKGLENQKKMQSEFIADFENEVAVTAQNMKKAGKAQADINAFIVESNRQKLEELKDQEQEAFEARVDFAKYYEAAQKTLLKDANDETAKITVKHYEDLLKIQNETEAARKQFQRQFNLDVATLDADAAEKARNDKKEAARLAAENQKKADEEAYKARQKAIDDLLAQRKKEREWEEQGNAEMEAMMKKHEENVAEIEDTAFIESLRRGEREFKIERDNLSKTLAGRIQLIIDAKNKELAAVKAGTEAAAIIEENANQKIFQEKVKQAQMYVQLAQQTANALMEINKLVTANEDYALNQAQYAKDAAIENDKNRTQEQIDREIAATNTRLNNEQLSASERENIIRQSEARQRAIQMQSKNAQDKMNKDFAKKENELRKKQFEQTKALQIVTGIINTAAAVLQTLASVPYPANIPLAIAAGLAGAAQVAVIAAQKYDDKGFAASQTVQAAANIDTTGGGLGGSVPTTGANSPNGINPNTGKAVSQRSDIEKRRQQRVYVLEQDIRDVANRVDVFEQRATF